MALMTVVHWQPCRRAYGSSRSVW